MTAPKWTRTDQLFPRVAWLWPSDFDDAGKPVWQVERDRDRELLSCWPVVLYDIGGSTTEYLMLHAIRGNGNDGGEILLSISHQPRFDYYAQEVLAQVPLQSNPKRYREMDYREDGA